MRRDNEVAVRWVPEHQGIEGNERANELAKAAAEGESPANAVSDECRWEADLSCMARAAAKAKARTTAQRASDRVSLERKYRPPPGKGLRRRQPRRTCKSVAGRYFQLLSGHAAIGPYLKDKIKKTDSDECWWCGGGSSRPAIISLQNAEHGPLRPGWVEAVGTKGPIGRAPVEGQGNEGCFGLS